MEVYSAQTGVKPIRTLTAAVILFTIASIQAVWTAESAKLKWDSQLSGELWVDGSLTFRVPNDWPRLNSNDPETLHIGGAYSSGMAHMSLFVQRPALGVVKTFSDAFHFAARHCDPDLSEPLMGAPPPVRERLGELDGRLIQFNFKFDGGRYSACIFVDLGGPRRPTILTLVGSMEFAGDIGILLRRIAASAHFSAVPVLTRNSA